MAATIRTMTGGRGDRPRDGSGGQTAQPDRSTDHRKEQLTQLLPPRRLLFDVGADHSTP